MASTKAGITSPERPRQRGRPWLGGPWLGAPWLSRPWVRWLVTAGAWAAAVALISYMVVSALTNPGHQLLADLHVYRNGGRAVLDGRSLYSTVTNGKLLFTYPP